METVHIKINGTSYEVASIERKIPKITLISV